jgi:hypothetical protein
MIHAYSPNYAQHAGTAAVFAWIRYSLLIRFLLVHFCSAGIAVRRSVIFPLSFCIYYKTDFNHNYVRSLSGVDKNVGTLASV